MQELKKDFVEETILEELYKEGISPDIKINLHFYVIIEGKRVYLSRDSWGIDINFSAYEEIH
jgi:hypothetical protein